MKNEYANQMDVDQADSWLSKLPNRSSKRMKKRRDGLRKIQAKELVGKKKSPPPIGISPFMEQEFDT